MIYNFSSFKKNKKLSPNGKDFAPLWIKLCYLFVSVSIAFILGSYFALAVKQKLNDNLFSINNIEITKTKVLSAADINHKLKNFYHSSIYEVDLHEINSTLTKHPWIQSVVIKKIPPQQLSITINERKAVALLLSSPTHLVDEKANIFPIKKTNLFSHLPIITGLEKNFLNEYNNLQFKKQISLALLSLRTHKLSGEVGGKISKIKINPYYGITAYFNNDLTVILGKNDFLKKWKKLNQVINNLQKNNKFISYAFLNNQKKPHHISIKYANN